MENKNASFIRWQGRQIEEFGKVINLLLTLSIATVAFTTTKLLSIFTFSIFCAKLIVLLGCFILLITTALLLFVIRNRLKSFRETTKIARHREKLDTSELSKWRKNVKKMDATTWVIFDCALLTFIFGELLIILGAVLEILK